MLAAASSAPSTLPRRLLADSELLEVEEVMTRYGLPDRGPAIIVESICGMGRAYGDVKELIDDHQACVDLPVHRAEDRASVSDPCRDQGSIAGPADE